LSDAYEHLFWQYALVWLLWLLSQTWITLHIWKPNVDRLMRTEVLFTMPMYDSMFIDQSLALNRRHDKDRRGSTEVKTKVSIIYIFSLKRESQ
jgi:chitin synthase